MSPTLIEVKLRYDPYAKDETEINDSDLIVTLLWRSDIYICTKLINPQQYKEPYKFYINDTNKIARNSSKEYQFLDNVQRFWWMITDIISPNKMDARIELTYNSTFRILVDSIAIYDNEIPYNITSFCAPNSYDYLKRDIKSITLGNCKQTLFADHSPRLYDNIGIGQKSKIISEVIQLPADFRSFPHQQLEGYVIPPLIKEIMIKVSPIEHHNSNPQTQVPINATLYWYDKQYTCTMHPVKPDTEYYCALSADANKKKNASELFVCDINEAHYDTFVLILEKEGGDKDALALDKFSVTDITNNEYIVNKFCVSPETFDYMDVCWPTEVKDDPTCGDDKYCPYSCIDGDSCSLANKLAFYFPKDVFVRNNEFGECIVEYPRDHQSGTCDSHSNYPWNFHIALNDQALLYDNGSTVNIKIVNSWKTPEQEALEAWIMSIIAIVIAVATLWCVWCICCVVCKRMQKDEPTFLPNLQDRSWTDVRDQSLSEPLYDHHDEDSVLGDRDNAQEEDIKIDLLVNEKKNN